MDFYQNSREAVLSTNQEMAALIQQAESVLGGNEAVFKQWRLSCGSIARQLQEHIVQIAVVGAIKSGKSTLVNALLEDDYLKRGAGVVTSIVTRVRQGNELRARLFFKSWDEINTEIQQALVLFPSDDWRSDTQNFDIRRSQDRGDLKKAIDALDSELRIVQDSLNANGVLLSSYIKGYDRIKAYVTSDSAIREFDKGNFPEHREFVGHDALAVYLKDVQLEVTGDVLTRNIEIADCQGSDSPNPLHLAMIQDYLVKAHLIIYVVSSRTGIRQADIRFLSIIKRMGIAANMLFVCNCDFSEHENLNDLQTLIQKIKEELALIIDAPQMFTLSALYNLFSVSKTMTAPKYQDRLLQWRKANQLVTFSDDETRRLIAFLDRKLTRERSALLLQNQMERIDVTATGLRQWLRLNRNLMQRDAADAHDIAERLHSHQNNMNQVQSMIQNTLEGSVRKVTEELKKEVDRFFELHSGPILKKVLVFIRDYHVDLSRYQEQLRTVGFTRTLYLVYQEFKQAVDGLMAEKINPEIVGFISKKEKHLRDFLRSAAEPYEAMVRDALIKYEDALVQFGLGRVTDHWTFNVDPDLANIKQVTHLTLPPAAATMRYSAQIKTEAVMRLGFYSLVRAMRKLLKKPLGAEKAEETKALKDGIRKMKIETERSIVALFRDYKENVKFQYLQRLAELAGNWLHDLLKARLGAYVGDVKGFVAAIADKRSDKERVDATLAALDEAATALQLRLAKVRQEVREVIEGKE